MYCIFYAKYAKFQNGVSENSDYFDMLVIERARIIKGAENKIYVQSKIIKENFQNSQKWLIYCDTVDQLQKVKNDLKEYGFDSLEYHTKMESKPETVLNQFNSIGGILLSINCLDEGVDIPSLSHAIILSSSKNPRQFIQRRGRVLRKAPGKTFAYIYDGIIIPPKNEIDSQVDAIVYKGELARAIQFSQSSINSSEQSKLINIAKDINIPIEEILSVTDSDISNLEEDVD